MKIKVLIFKTLRQNKVIGRKPNIKSNFRIVTLVLVRY